jgi:methyl-accepting chemotaxis protein
MATFRKSFWINPRLQFKILLTSLVLTLVTAAIVYATLSNILFTSERLMELSTFEIESFQSSLRFSLVWITIILLLIFGIENILRFHRFVGPLFVIEKMVNTFASGDLSQDFKLRREDELKDLVDDLLTMRDQLKGFVAKDRQSIKNIEERLNLLSDALQKGAPSSEMKAQIDEIRKELPTITSEYKI